MPAPRSSPPSASGLRGFRRFRAGNFGISIAGIASFAVNIALAALLAVRWKGAGIAAALSVSSAVNTVLLFVLLKRKLSGSAAGMTRRAAVYTGKIILFSLIAAVPVVLTKAPLAALFAPRNANPAGLPRFLQNLLPFLAGALLFAATGILLLAATGDRNMRVIMRWGKARKKE